MGRTSYLVYFLLIFKFASVSSLPRSLIVSAAGRSTREIKNEEEKSERNFLPRIYEMDINSNVTNRFAKTQVISKVKNADTTSRETTFAIILPESAFISEFIMEIDGKSYKAYVEEKKEAKKIYDTAREQGQAAAHVETSARDSNRFTVSVNLEPESKAVFYLTYEELLQRQNGMYELVLNIHPGQIVKDLNVEVRINETRPLAFVRTPSLRSGNEISKNEENLKPNTNIDILNDTSAVVTFKPSAEDQRQFGKVLVNKENEGIAGQMVVQYDVERDPKSGEILLNDGYFVHFFAPKDVQPLPKHVVFVLDTSGSMSGEKIDQLREALKNILDQIKGDNLLSLMEFNFEPIVYNMATGERKTINRTEDLRDVFREQDLPTSYPTTDEVMQKAREISQQLYASGSTSMMAALKSALSLVKESQIKHEKKFLPMIIFLTDGQPTDAQPDAILQEITKLNKERNNAPIFTLSFGNGADKDFLRKLSTQNNGFSRHIYEGADAAIQLQEYYKIIASPLLSNLNFAYTDNAEDVTRTKFPIFFSGGEIVVAGKIPAADVENNEKIAVTGLGVAGPITFRPISLKPATSLQRLWAYLTVKQILEDRKVENDEKKKEELTKKALELAREHSFVTDVTSLVVVKPNQTTAVDTEDASSITTGNFGFSGTRVAAFSGGFSNRALYGYSSYRSIPLAPPMPSLAVGYTGAPLYQPQSTYQTMYDSSAVAGVTEASQLILLPEEQEEEVSTATSIKATLADSLPWLATIMNKNGTVTLPQGTFELGEEETAHIPSAECTNPVLGKQNVKGLCTLIGECPDAFAALTDVSVYQKHFCTLDNNRFLGVCCKEKMADILSNNTQAAVPY